MTDLSLRDTRRTAQDAPAPPKTRKTKTRKTWALLLFSTFALASALGFAIGHAAPGDGGAFEPNLILLLRFMAAMKFAGVVGALALVAWRLARPAPSRVALGYVGAVATMAVAPGLIWSLAHIGLAAGLFHAGLLGCLILAWTDQDALVPAGRYGQASQVRANPSACSRAAS